MFNVALKKKRRMIGILLPLVLVASLLIVGTVFADDEIVPETDAAVAEESVESTSEETSPAETSDTQEEDAASEESEQEETADEPVVLEEDTDSTETTDEPVLSDEEEVDETDEADEEQIDETEAAPGAGDAEEGDTEEETSTEEEQLPDEEESTDPDEVVEDTEESEDLSDTTASLAEEDVTLVDENGETLDLASESSQETISSADPWWIVNGVKYAYVKTGGTCPADADYCYESDTPISSALEYMDTNDLVPSDGILHVESDSYTEDVTVDGSSGNGNLASLKGIVSEGSSSDTTITGTVTISNTTSGFTLSGFTIVGSLVASDNTGTLTLEDVTVESSTGTGISVTNQNGAVNVDQVAADSNAGYGMYVDNTASSKSSVTVTNSEFNHNTGGSDTSGLYIKTNGKIILEGVSASGNTGSGAILDAVRGTTITSGVFSNNDYSGIYIENSNTGNDVTLTDVQLDSNGYEGMYLLTAGSVTLENVTVYQNGSDNSDDGVYIDTTSGKGAVTISDSTFNENSNYGAQIYTKGNVNLSGITADENTSGFLIDACISSDGVCQGKGTVTISGKQLNSFNNNSDTGLTIYASRNVYLSYFVADGNANGIYISNDYSGSTGNVTIVLAYTPVLGDFINSVSNNTSSGLQIYSRGNISVEDLVVTGNGTSGSAAVVLDNDAAASAKYVIVKSIDVYGNSNTGLLINSVGNVTVYKVNAYGNTGNGLEIDTSGGSGRIKIYTSRSSTLDYSDNGNYGIYITSAGTVSLSSIDATGNSYGLYIDNTARDKRTVSVSNSDFSNSSAGTGVQILSSGTITLSSVVSSNNNISGIVLDNTTGSGGQKIRISNIETSSNTTGSGIVIDSLGMVVLSNITSSSNYLAGLEVDNCQESGGVCVATTGVKISGSNEFNSNGNNGLTIVSGGTVVLINVTADSNTGYGLSIDQTYSTKTPSVKLSSSKGSTNSFSSNTIEGVYVLTSGIVKLSGLEANNNSGGNGITIQNQTSTTARSVTVNNVTASENANNGLYILSAGSVVLKGIETLNNTADGIYVENTYNDSTKSVTIKSAGKGSTSVTSSGNANGMDIITNGTINITSVDISGNIGYGATLNNETGDGKSVVLRDAAFDDNGTLGVTIVTTGTITWKAGSASGNQSGNGASLDNTSATSNKAVYVSGADFDGNSSSGLVVNSLGNITLNLVGADSNDDGSGVILDNCQYNDTSGVCEGSGWIYVRGTDGEDDFNSNSQNGLVADSANTITLMNVGANYNGSIGIDLDNEYSGITAGISVKTNSKKYHTDITNNGSDGLYLRTNGAIYLANLNASNNGDNGIDADNSNGTLEKSATLLRILTSSNTSDGVKLVTKGEIVVNDGQAYDNGGNGFNLDNSGASSSQNVSVGRFIADGQLSGSGLYITTIGDVALNNIVATNNSNGVYVYGLDGVDNQLTLKNSKGENIFSDNSGDGLAVYMQGDVNLIGVTAEGNDGNGVVVQTSGTLKVTKGYLYRNTGSGLTATANLGATINSVQSFFNGSTSDGDGLNLTVDDGSTVKLIRSYFVGNYGDGIEISGNTDPYLYKTYYYGNDMDNDGDKNLNLY